MEELRHKKAGDLGFEFFKSLFDGFEKYSFLQATPEQDMYQGIDGFILNVADQSHAANIDVKNTQDLYFLNVDIATKKMVVRHPLKKSSKTTHVAVVSATTKQFLGFHQKEQWLSHFVKESVVATFVNELNSLDGLTYDELLGTTQSISQACFKLKMSLIPYLKSNCYISYEEPNESEGKISFKIYSSEKHYLPVQLTETLIDDINNIAIKPTVKVDSTQYKPHEKITTITI